MNRVDPIEKPRLRDDLPDFRAGDTVRVHVRVVEAGRERIQVFQGVVIRRRGGGIRESFTARKVSFGVGVERTFPLHSPSVSKIEVLTRGDVRRAKLYYLRERRGKRARIRELRSPIGAAIAPEPEEALEGPVAAEPEDVETAEPEEVPEAAKPGERPHRRGLRRKAKTEEPPEATEAEESPAAEAPEGEE